MKRLTGSLLTIFFILNVSYAQETIISGTIKNLTANSLKCNLIPNRILEKPVAITIPLTDGKFTQNLSITKTTLLSFEEGTNYYGGFIQPGDSIVITYDAASLKKTLLFSGKGKEKFTITDSILQLREIFNSESEKIKKLPFPADYLFNKIDSLQNKLTRRLISDRSLMSKESFNQLNAFIKANVLRAKYNGVTAAFGTAYDNILKKHQSKLTPSSKKALQNLLSFDGSLSYSYFYTSNVSSVFSVYYDENIKPGVGDDLESKYSYINRRLPLNLKAPVLFFFLEREIRQNKNAAIESIIEASFPISKDSSYKKFITQKLIDARALKKGIAAPEFLLENTNGEKVSLSSFKGKVIYMDFWFAACVPCHELFNEVKPIKEYFKSDSNVVFLIVSVDNSDVWKNALKKFSIDGYHAFTENKFRDHPVIRAYNVNEYPTTYLIDKKGEIFNINPSHNAGELKKEIEAALATASN